MATNPFKHIKLSGPDDSMHYASAYGRGGENNIPKRNRKEHGERISRQLDQAWRESENKFLVAYPERAGIYLEFISAPGFELMIKSLEDLRQGIRLCNVRTETSIIDDEETETTFATVFVPTDKREFFFEKVNAYLIEGKNAKLVDSIEELRTALLIESFWTDGKSLMPGEQPEWCEVWLRAGSENGEQVAANFEAVLDAQQINSKPGHIKFPERIVKLIRVNRAQLQNLSKNSDDIAEYRRAKDTAEFFLGLQPFEQQEWIDDLLGRLSVDEKSRVRICLLDTGVNNGHPLLLPVLPDSNCLAVVEAWGTHDHSCHGHGTLMAGVAAYNNLQELFESSENITLYHKLESVKILPPRGQNEPELWGDIMSQAISIAEINSPESKRVICSAVTALDTRDRGRPTSWSGAIDNIASGAFDNEKRLLILAAGNVANFNQITSYPVNQETDSIHDPGQSWNALTVGAYTTLTDITDPSLNDYQPLAQSNQLSPFSTTSLTWESKWPIKPDVVFEGGNIAVDPSGKWTECNDFSLISTHHQPTLNLLSPFNMTSLATAQAAHFAARIQAMYPDYWPETIRGLIVHSANWPEELFRQFVRSAGSKKEIERLMRRVGYGVPNIGRALYSAANSLTLISEAEIQPFVKEKGKKRTNEMHLYRLPWPVQILQELGGAEVKMRITLSYFIEPGPGEIGWEDRYRYPSHGLRFQINSPTETEDDFVARINRAVRDDVHEKPGTKSPSKHWVIGQRCRDKGSIHSDIWEGTAAQLALSNLVAVYPSIGWWKERSYLKKINNKARYSLIVSIETQEQDIDIYTPIAVQLKQGVSIGIRTTR